MPSVLLTTTICKTVCQPCVSISQIKHNIVRVLHNFSLMPLWTGCMELSFEDYGLSGKQQHLKTNSRVIQFAGWTSKWCTWKTRVWLVPRCFPSVFWDVFSKTPSKLLLCRMYFKHTKKSLGKIVSAECFRKYTQQRGCLPSAFLWHSANKVCLPKVFFWQTNTLFVECIYKNTKQTLVSKYILRPQTQSCITYQDIRSCITYKVV